MKQPLRIVYRGFVAPDANTMGPNDNHFGILAAIEAGADYVQTDRLDILIPWDPALSVLSNSLFQQRWESNKAFPTKLMQ